MIYKALKNIVTSKKDQSILGGFFLELSFDDKIQASLFLTSSCIDLWMLRYVSKVLTLVG
jgi:hypothetical protein